MSFREFTEEEATTLGELIGIDWAAGDVDSISSGWVHGRA